MTLDEERQFLSELVERLAQGGELGVNDIHRAFEARVWHKVAQTTIYRMLDRHDWRTIMPRPCHPKK